LTWSCGPPGPRHAPTSGCWYLVGPPPVVVVSALLACCPAAHRRGTALSRIKHRSITSFHAGRAAAVEVLADSGPARGVSPPPPPPPPVPPPPLRARPAMSGTAQLYCCGCCLDHCTSTIAKPRGAATVISHASQSARPRQPPPAAAPRVRAARAVPGPGEWTRNPTVAHLNGRRGLQTASRLGQLCPPGRDAQ